MINYDNNIKLETTTKIFCVFNAIECLALPLGHCGEDGISMSRMLFLFFALMWWIVFHKIYKYHNIIGDFNHILSI